MGFFVSRFYAGSLLLRKRVTGQSHCVVQHRLLGGRRLQLLLLKLRWDLALVEPLTDEGRSTWETVLLILLVPLGCLEHFNVRFLLATVLNEVAAHLLRLLVNENLVTIVLHD